MHEFSFKDAPRELTNEQNATEVFLQALSKSPARTLSLRNYPHYPSNLYDLLDVHGRTGKISLAEIDLTTLTRSRVRERNLPRYNDARRQLLLEPYYAALDELRTTRKN